jgi:hypothetical protein
MGVSLGAPQLTVSCQRHLEQRKTEDAALINVKKTHRICFSLVGIFLFVALLLLFNILPGQAPATAATFADLGFAKCIQNSPGVFNFACSNAGFPYGSPSTFGLPVNVLTVAASSGLHLSTLDAVRLAYGILLAIAFFGALQFFGKVTENRWIALLGAALFLASPIVSFEDGYGPLRIGFALLPTYAYVNLCAIDRFSRARIEPGAACLWLIALCATNSFAMFCDGYSFVMSLLLSGLLWATWLLDEFRGRTFVKAGAGSLVALTSVVIPLLLYKAYIPEAQYTPMPLDFFRGQGIDLYFLGVPSATTWVAKAMGLHHSVSGYQVYSDGPSSSLVYMGYSFLACGLICASLVFKYKLKDRKLVLPVLVIGLIALLLSLGPALKFHDLRPGSGGSISFTSYLMPAGKATLELGTGWIYEHVPGINIMRALYRWQLLVRLALVTCAVSVLGLLVTRRRRTIAAVLAIALLAETTPVFPPVVARGHANANMISQFNAQVVEDFRAHIAPRSKVLFLQLHPGASQNQYLASYICAEANLLCYNVGGDKAAELAANAWPAPVFELVAGENVSFNVHDILHSGLADAIVVPFFDLRMQAYAWPPRSFPRADVIAKLQKDFAQYDVQMTQWFALIKLHGGRVTANQSQLAGQYEEGQIATIGDWGPKRFKSGAKQKIYIWVKTSDAPPIAAVAIGSHVLATLHNKPGVLAAPVRPEAEEDILQKDGTYAVYLIDREKHLRQKLGQTLITH